MTPLLRIVGILLMVAVLVGAGRWYLVGQAPDYKIMEPRLSLGQVLGGGTGRLCTGGPSAGIPLP